MDLSELVKAVNELLVGSANQIDEVDSHFAQHPPVGRALTDDEVAMLQCRRAAVVTLRQVRDSADTFITTAGTAPCPFYAGISPYGEEAPRKKASASRPLGPFSSGKVL